mgnify:FL=1
MDKQKIKAALYAIFLGACVSFFTALFDGMKDLLNGYGNNVAGGVTSTIIYRALTGHV